MTSVLTSALAALAGILLFVASLGLVAIGVYILIRLMSKLHIPNDEDIKKP